MIIFWIKKRKKNGDEDPGPWTSQKDSFHKHDQKMEKFRQAHPDMNIVSSKDIMTADGDVWAPVQKVKLTEPMKN